MTTYEQLSLRYRGYVALLHREILGRLSDQGFSEDEAVLTLDHLYAGATGTTATTWCALADVQDIGQALPLLTQVLCAFVALKSADVAMRGIWTAHEHPAMPGQDALAELLQVAWRAEQG
jgi:hypothetical protein